MVTLFLLALKIVDLVTIKYYRRFYKGNDTVLKELQGRFNEFEYCLKNLNRAIDRKGEREGFKTVIQKSVFSAVQESFRNSNLYLEEMGRDISRNTVSEMRRDLEKFLGNLGIKPLTLEEKDIDTRAKA